MLLLYIQSNTRCLNILIIFNIQISIQKFCFAILWELLSFIQMLILECWKDNSCINKSIYDYSLSVTWCSFRCWWVREEELHHLPRCVQNVWHCSHNILTSKLETQIWWLDHWGWVRNWLGSHSHSVTPSWVLHPALGSLAWGGCGSVEASPEEAMEMLRGLELLSYKDRVRQLGLLRLEKMRLWGHLIAPEST